MPVLPSCLLEPLWDQFAALLPEHVDTHPLGCHNPRIADRVVFEHVIAALVHGSGYERVASPGCSDRTIRRRVEHWAGLGIAEQLHALALQAYDRMIGLELGELSVDGCITKAPCGGEAAGRSPVDRGKHGLKRSMGVDGNGIPLGAVAAPANRPDSPLLEPTLDALDLGPLAATVHLDRGYDSGRTRQRLADRGLTGAIAAKGQPDPLTAGRRWVVERTHAWTNAHKKLVWCTERRMGVIDFWLAFSAVVVITGRLVREAWTRYRWEDRPSRRP